MFVLILSWGSLLIWNQIKYLLISLDFLCMSCGYLGSRNRDWVENITAVRKTWKCIINYKIIVCYHWNTHHKLCIFPHILFETSASLVIQKLFLFWLFWFEYFVYKFFFMLTVKVCCWNWYFSCENTENYSIVDNPVINYCWQSDNHNNWDNHHHK